MSFFKNNYKKIIFIIIFSSFFTFVFAQITNINISNNSINENSIIGSEIGTLTTVGGDSPYTYELTSGIGNEDNSKFEIVGDKLNLNFVPDYENPQDQGGTVGDNNYSVRVKVTDSAGGLSGYSKYQKGTVQAGMVSGSPEDIPLYIDLGSMFPYIETDLYNESVGENNWVVGRSAGGCSASKNADHLAEYCPASNSTDVSYVTNNSYDLTYIKEIQVEWDTNGTSPYGIFLTAGSDKNGMARYDAYRLVHRREPAFGRRTETLNVESAIGNYYIKASIEGAGFDGKGVSKARFYKITLIGLDDTATTIFDTSINGGDIRVTLPDGTTEIPREVVDYDQALKTGELWIKKSGILSEGDEVLVWYNGTSSDYLPTDIYGRNAVWSDYRLNWNLKDNQDSTINNFDGIINGATQINNGIIGKAYNFDGSNDYINNTEGVFQGGSQRYTLWVSLDTIQSGGRYILGSKRSGNNRIYIWSDGGNLKVTIGGVTVDTGVDFIIDLDYKITVEKTSTTLFDVYVNGIKTNNAIAYADFTPSTQFSLGRGEQDGNAYSNSYIDGRIDNFCVTEIKGENWEITEYNNQTTPEQFWHWTAEEIMVNGIYEKQLQIQINDVIENHTPTNITLSNSTINENETSGTTIGTLTTTDTDTGDTHTYTLVSGTGDEDNSKFTISNNELKLNFTPDYELPTDQGDTIGNNTYSIRIQTDDNHGGIYIKSLIITVTDINENPTITSSNSDITIQENSTENLITITATDNDTPSQTLTYSVSGTDSSLFTINPTTGVLSFTNSPDYELPLDNNEDNTYTVTITVTDDGIGNLTDTQTLNITVTDTDEGKSGKIKNKSTEKVCKDPKAINYKKIGLNTKSLCKYEQKEIKEKIKETRLQKLIENLKKQIEEFFKNKQPISKKQVCNSFTKDYKLGDRAEEVKKIQKFLKEQNFFHHPYITNYYGPVTNQAVKLFQNQYKNEILKPLNLKTPTGNWYIKTRTKANSLINCK